MTFPVKVLTCWLLLISLTMAQGSDRNKNNPNRNDPLPPAWSPQEIEEMLKKGLIPLQLGSRWTYRVTLVDANGSETLDEKRINEVRGAYLFEGQTWYQLHEFGGSVWAANSQKGQLDGVIEFNTETEFLELASSTTFFPFPVNVGETYHPRAEGLFAPITVTALTEDVRVPLGTFKCIIYESRDESTQNPIDRFYISPGVGIVKYEFMNGERTEVYELEEYLPGGKPAQPPELRK